jgi:hypothetical protein
MAAVMMIRSGKRVGFECLVCRIREMSASADAAKAARMKHVALSAHRSSLRAARRA